MFLDLRKSPTVKFDNLHVIHPDQLEDGTNDIPFFHTNKVLTNSIYAVVWSAVSSKCKRNLLSKYHLSTSLCYRVKMEEFLRLLVEVTSFDQKCFAFMNTVGCG
jgi:ribosome biogenesis protein Nip4